MDVPRVYADFNALPSARPLPGSPRVRMEITGLGTIRSLAGQGLRLFEGMSVLLFEPGDIQCLATMHFDLSLADPAGRAGAWTAELDPSEIEDSMLVEQTIGHPCLSCGRDLDAYLASAGFNYTQNCPHCGASVMEPMAAPSR